MTNEKHELQEEVKNTSLQATEAEDAVLGYEDEEEGDMIIPRVKIIQLMSPEFKSKEADEGDIINSLTKEKLTGKKFIPVFKFNNNIWWKPRSEGGGINCIAKDGKMGVASDGVPLACKMCKKNEFDNSKQGAEAIPVCTKYMNFFGFFEDEFIPTILSFSKTNYAEGKKLFSLAKVTMQNMWHNGYTLEAKLMKKGGNEWYNINPVPAGATTEQERAHGKALYQQFRNINDFNFDIDEGTGSGESAPPADDEATEY